MNARSRTWLAGLAVVAIFLAVQLGSLALIESFETSYGPVVEDTGDPVNSGIFFGVILVATAIMLLAFRYDADRFIRLLIVGVSAMLSWYVFAALFPSVVVSGVDIVAALAAVGIGVALLSYPEWYVIDAAGVLMAAGAATLFGISFGPLPALLFLSVLAVYDAISVYRTEHMLSLADGVFDLKIPVVFVVPTTRSYSYLVDDGPLEGVDDTSADGNSNAEHSADSDADGDADPSDDSVRDALFIGLGDAVIPTILVVSAASFLDVPAVDLPGLTVNVPALGAIAGTTVGLVILLRMVLRGRAHAGLPLLNGGAIAGYLLGALASSVPLATAIGL
ncbi:presenilin family intramembrane aspartyl protease PSH [Halovivax limisalsi]|uniref:presenilin family intramembrane aspartyl protease PSH n=1 Tax=Halovivax limisalsi TaxID=1453760 RepID=UPI001FFD68C5|nr:presenilin family intramembrane aspartyl protease PSH [Halovivax limisalsi]